MVASTDTDNILCDACGRIDVIATHVGERRGYVSRCVLPCGCEGVIVGFVATTADGERRELWVH